VKTEILLEGISLPKPSKAYGTRYLTSHNNGPVVRIRRALDNKEADIDGRGFVCGLDGIKAIEWSHGIGYIATHYDQSGNGHHLTQPVAALQPEYHEP
jgi:hypothetical protein